MPKKQNQKNNVFSRLGWNHYAALTCVVAMLALMLLSLRHQTKGLNLLTGDTLFNSGLLAFGIEFSIFAGKLAIAVAAVQSILGVTKPVKIALIFAWGISAVINITSFTKGKAQGLDSWAAVRDNVPQVLEIASCIALGLFIPTAIYCLASGSIALWQNNQAPKPLDADEVARIRRLEEYAKAYIDHKGDRQSAANALEKSKAHFNRELKKAKEEGISIHF